MTTPAENVLNHDEAGSGPPVLLLDWTPWDRTALEDPRAFRYRVISIEPPDPAGPAGTAWEVAEVVAGCADSIQLDSYTLVGVSLGAEVAFRLALLRPASVTTLVLVSPTCVAPRSPLPWNTPELAADTMLAHPAHFRPNPGQTAALAALAERWQADGGDATALLPDLTCPTLVIFGQEDRLVSRKAGAIWKERVPNCNVCYVYDAGHAVGVDRPDALTNVVLDFVERRETFIVENRSSLINP